MRIFGKDRMAADQHRHASIIFKAAVKCPVNARFPLAAYFDRLNVSRHCQAWSPFS